MMAAMAMSSATTTTMMILPQRRRASTVGPVKATCRRRGRPRGSRRRRDGSRNGNNSPGPRGRARQGRRRWLWRRRRGWTPTRPASAGHFPARWVAEELPSAAATKRTKKNKKTMTMMMMMMIEDNEEVAENPGGELIGRESGAEGRPQKKGRPLVFYLRPHLWMGSRSVDGCVWRTPSGHVEEEYRMMLTPLQEIGFRIISPSKLCRLTLLLQTASSQPPFSNPLECLAQAMRSFYPNPRWPVEHK